MSAGYYSVDSPAPNYYFPTSGSPARSRRSPHQRQEIPAQLVPVMAHHQRFPSPGAAGSDPYYAETYDAPRHPQRHTSPHGGFSPARRSPYSSGTFDDLAPRQQHPSQPVRFEADSNPLAQRSPGSPRREPVRMYDPHREPVQRATAAGVASEELNSYRPRRLPKLPPYDPHRQYNEKEGGELPARRQAPVGHAYERAYDSHREVPTYDAPQERPAPPVALRRIRRAGGKSAAYDHHREIKTPAVPLRQPPVEASPPRYSSPGRDARMYDVHREAPAGMMPLPDRDPCDPPLPSPHPVQTSLHAEIRKQLFSRTLSAGDVRAVLRENVSALTMEDDDGVTPLALCADSGLFQLMVMLLEDACALRGHDSISHMLQDMELRDAVPASTAARTSHSARLRPRWSLLRRTVCSRPRDFFAELKTSNDAAIGMQSSPRYGTPSPSPAILSQAEHRFEAIRFLVEKMKCPVTTTCIEAARTNSMYLGQQRDEIIHYLQHNEAKATVSLYPSEGESKRGAPVPLLNLPTAAPPPASTMDNRRSRPITYADDFPDEAEEPPHRAKKVSSKKRRRGCCTSFFYHPVTRILALLLLMASHFVAYSLDTDLRCDEIPSSNSTSNDQSCILSYGDHGRSFPFLFNAVHFIGFHYPDSGEHWEVFTAKITLYILGMVLGGLFAVFVLHMLLFRRLLRMRLFGAGHCIPDPDLEQSQSDATDGRKNKKDGPKRGMLVCLFYGAIGGAYALSHLYNVIVDAEDQYQESWKAASALPDVTAFDLWLTLFAITIGMDVIILWTVIDTMVQQMVHKAHNPSGCCKCPSWNVWRWILLILVVLPILFCVSFFTATSPDYIDVDDVFHISNDEKDALRVAVTGMCLQLMVVAMIQEWSWPTTQPPGPDVRLPLVSMIAYRPWCHYFMCLLLLMIDGRHMYVLLKSWADKEETSGEWWYVVLSLIPTAGAITLFFIWLLASMEAVAGSGSDVVSLRSGGEELVEEDATPDPDAEGSASDPESSRSSEDDVAVPIPHLVEEDEPLPARRATVAPKPKASRSTDDLYSAALENDVESLRLMLDRRPGQLDLRGGPGLQFRSGKVNLLRPTEGREESDTKRSPQTLRRMREKCAATALHYAIYGNAYDTARELLRRGADGRVRTASGYYTAAELAKVLGRIELEQLLAQAGYT